MDETVNQSSGSDDSVDREDSPSILLGDDVSAIGMGEQYVVEFCREAGGSWCLRIWIEAPRGIEPLLSIGIEMSLQAM